MFIPILKSIAAIPTLPLLYIQGKRVKAEVPDLPEAEGKKGFVGKTGKAFSVLILGESTMAGVGVGHQEQGFAGYLGRYLADKLPDHLIKWEVVAKSGYKAADVIQHLVPQLPKNKPNWLVIGLGGNDTFQFSWPWKWRRDMGNLMNILEKKYPQTPITCIHLPPVHRFPVFTPLLRWVMNNWVEMLRIQLYKEVRNRPNVFFIKEELNFDDWMKKHNPLLVPADFFSDGVHPNELAYKVWAKEVVMKLER